jgi:hypothetical protein
MIDKLSENCKDIKYDTEYIKSNLISTLSDKKMVINNEWGQYFALGDFGQKRVCRLEFEQFVHPLTEAITGKTIYFKTTPIFYTPSYEIGNYAASLPIAPFEPKSFNNVQIPDVLRSKRLSGRS